MKRRTIASAFFFFPLAVFGQAAAPLPSFEVATIKPAPPSPDGKIMTRMGGDPGRVNYTNVTLKNVLTQAYKVKSYQITGPSWIGSERYDIIAKVPDGTPREQVPLMLQQLLADRFKLTVHRETKEQPVYALVVGKGGLKMEKSKDDFVPPANAAVVAPPAGQAAHGPAPAPGAGGRGGMIMMRPGRMEARHVTLAAFADTLSNMLDRPVLDMTGVEGAYDVNLDMSLDSTPGFKGIPGHAMPPGAEAPPAPDPAAPSIFTAIQQLGLRLEPRKAPVEYIVIDRGEKVPTEN